ncbi:MAG: hypothetical protein C4291_08335 [Candidatus Dadabacteria bacterium]
MKRLIAITTLGLAFGFSSLSFALDNYNIFGVQIPLVKSEVKNETKSGDVERDYMSFYTTPKTVNAAVPLITADQKVSDEYISVFGVQIPRNPGS